MPQDQKNKVIVAREKKKKKGKNPNAQVSEMKSLISEVASLKRKIAVSTLKKKNRRRYGGGGCSQQCR